ncbi:Hypothetical protein, putative [Bodo saltans]|uniref:Uncharacterized protein n=1 Tax=Bodo saltans TaxID=75058 RepID=A0A0S4IU49_BODSA|nr:Hypothetical protein, putative [Bodo saltans]|eukprot:CUF92536.1 Hypothetical protein, putative [Bodo saltans]
MACVLCDGSGASLKAIDLAVVPQLVLQQHKDEQLIMIHGFEEVSGAAYSATTPPNPVALQQQAAAFQTVVNITLEQIDKHKHAKDQLNYKIEMFRATSKPPAVIRPSSAAPSAQVPGSARAQTPSSKPGTGRGGPHSPAAPMPTEDDHSTDAKLPSSAELLGAYVAKRATHHNVHAFVLGVGNQSNGKTHSIGGIAKQLFRQQYNTSDDHTVAVNADGSTATSSTVIPGWALWYVKPTGSVVRPNSSVKFLVLLDAQNQTDSSLLSLQYTLKRLIVAGRGDRVGTLIITNNNVSGVVGVSTDGDDVREANSEKMIAEVTERLERAGFSDAVEPSGDESNASPSEEDGSPRREQDVVGAPLNPSPPNAFPLVSTLKLDGNNANPRPNVNDVPLQLTKALAKLKTDFLVIPPTKHHTLSEATVFQILGLLRPHVIVPPSSASQSD